MERVIFILFFFSWLTGFSQEIPAFKPLRYDEDYSWVKNDSAKSWYHQLKYSPLSNNGNTYLSIGGEMRFQYFYAQHEGWGDEPKDNDGYILARWLVHADLHAGRHFRTFIQLQSSLAGGRPTASPVDDNPLEIHQAFADVNFHWQPQAIITGRFGRQEFLYGSQRLISVRDGPNNRQAFDAIRFLYRYNSWKADFFYGHYVAARKNIFDDKFNKDAKLWGLYLIRNKIAPLKNIDLYYLGLWKGYTVFDDGIGKEIRHSIGTRIWNNDKRWRYDVEALYQFGKLDKKKIAAWTASLSTSYSLQRLKLKPEIGLKAEMISGDRSYDDNKLQTFNPLFPRGAYFGLAALIGPANLVDIHPSLSLNFSQKLSFDIDYDIFWRYSRNDGLYAVNMAMIYSGKNIKEKHVGNQLTNSVSWRPNEFIYCRAELTWFNSGGFLKKAGAGKDILFTGITTQLKF